MRRNTSAEGPVTRAGGREATDFGLFAPVAPLAFAQDGPLKSMVRHDDCGTSRSAALAIEPRLSELQAEIMAAFRHNGAMTDESLEQLPEFRAYAPSTVRKRRTELVRMCELRATKEKRANEHGSAVLTVWTVVK